MKSHAAEEPNIMQILVGDFNTSRVTAWGEDRIKHRPDKPKNKFLSVLMVVLMMYI